MFGSAPLKARDVDSLFYPLFRSSQFVFFFSPSHCSSSRRTWRGKAAPARCWFAPPIQTSRVPRPRPASRRQTPTASLSHGVEMIIIAATHPLSLFLLFLFSLYLNTKPEHTLDLHRGSHRQHSARKDPMSRHFLFSAKPHIFALRI